MTHTIKHPTQLWISDQHTLDKKVTEHLQQKLCSNNGCTVCMTCKQIASHEHPSIVWLTPERSYTLEQIDELITMSSFQLDANEQRFFIIRQAERLTDQCSNRLLKTIEEPFAGYNFFFLTSRAQALPLTIQSRCVVQKFKTTSNFDTYQDFLQPFLSLQFHQPITFIKQLDNLDIKEQETKELIDDLFEHWSVIMQENLSNNQPVATIENLVTILQQAIAHPPMTGSAKIFWKNLYLTAHHATKTYEIKN